MINTERMVNTEQLIRDALVSLPYGESTERTRRLLDAALHVYIDSLSPVPKPACTACHCPHCNSQKILKEFGW